MPSARTICNRDSLAMTEKVSQSRDKTAVARMKTRRAALRPQALFIRTITIALLLLSLEIIRFFMITNRSRDARVTESPDKPKDQCQQSQRRRERAPPRRRRLRCQRRPPLACDTTLQSRRRTGETGLLSCSDSPPSPIEGNRSKRRRSGARSRPTSSGACTSSSPT